MKNEKTIEENFPLIQKVSISLIETTPEHWNSFFVKVDVISLEIEPEDIEIVVRSSEGHDDMVFVTEELNESILILFKSFREKLRIKQFICNVFLKDDGNWGIKSEFDFFGEISNDP